MDSAGRVGSVDHRVEARRVRSVSSPRPVRCSCACRPRQQCEPRLALDGVRQDERLALEVDLEGERRLTGDATSSSRSRRPRTVRRWSSRRRALAGLDARAQCSRRRWPTCVCCRRADYIARAKSRPARRHRRNAPRVRGRRRAASGAATPPLSDDVGSSARRRLALAAERSARFRRLRSIRCSRRPFSAAFLDRVAARPDAVVAVLRALVQRARRPA